MVMELFEVTQKRQGPLSECLGEDLVYDPHLVTINQRNNPSSIISRIGLPMGNH